MREVLFVREAGDLALATSHLLPNPPPQMQRGPAREIELQALALLAALAQNLHTTICRSFTELSSDLRAKFYGGSRLAKSRRSRYSLSPAFAQEPPGPRAI